MEKQKLNNEPNSALHKTDVSHSMTGDGMNCLEFFDMIKNIQLV